MSLAPHFHVAILLVLLGGLLGCGGKVEPKAGKAETAEAPAGKLHKTYAADQLLPVSEKLPAADEGRVIVAVPPGWKTLQLTGKNLVAMNLQESGPAVLPRITVAAANAPAGMVGDTATTNAADHAVTLHALAGKSGAKLLESCKPLGLGEQVWIRHVRSSKPSGVETVAVQSLQSVRGGRLYTVELTVDAKDNPKGSKQPVDYQKSLEAYRDVAYTVAAHLEFPKSETPNSEAPTPAASKAKPKSTKTANSK